MADASTLEAPDADLAPDPGEAAETSVFCSFDLTGARVVSIDFRPKSTRVLLETQGEHGLQVLRVESPRPRAPEFEEIRGLLASVAARLCEVDKRVGNPVVLTGVAFKVNEEGSTGAILKATRKYANSFGELALNTPLRYTQDLAPERTFTSEDAAKMLRIYDAALAFVAGESAQGDLFASSGDGQASAVPTWEDDGGEALGRAKALASGDDAPAAASDEAATEPKPKRGRKAA